MTDNSKTTKIQLSVADAFSAAGAKLGGTALPILKLSKAGKWVVGADNMPVSDVRFAADVQNTRFGFVCFVGGEVVDEVLVPVALGKSISPDQLPDHGPYKDREGWVSSASLQLRGLETGDEFVFKPTSHGGRSAIGALLNKCSSRLRLGKTGIPIVELDVSSYEHRLYGPVLKPILKVVGWQDEADLINGAVEEPGNGLFDDDIDF